MTEPTSTAAAWLAGMTAAGAVLGLQPDTLLPGMLGGLVALSFAQPTSRARMAISVITSTIIAAYSAPVVAAVAMSWHEGMTTAGEGAVRALTACAIGVLTQHLVPAMQGIVSSGGSAIGQAVAGVINRWTGGPRS